MKYLKTSTKLLAIAVSAILLTFTACQKENVIENILQGNKVPAVNAGLNQTITLPTDTVTLAGSASDSDGFVVAYLWSQVSGPAPSVIINPGSPSTMATGLRQGTYVFQLMATDNDGATGVDTCSVLVKPSPIKTLTLQPANNPFEREIAIYNGLDVSQTGAPDIPLAAWTNGGLPITIREAVKFDLSSIPSSSTIISASLYLYSYPPPTLNGNLTDANFGSSNSIVLQQITSNWVPAATNWFSPPVTTTTNQIIIPHTTQSQLDLNLNVTSMVASMVNGNANYGFFLKLQNEVIYNSRIFVSSYNTQHTTKYPKLVVVYQ